MEFVPVGLYWLVETTSPNGVLFLFIMPIEPSNKRAIAFFDGQNLFFAVKEAFGYTYPNCDPQILAQKVALAHNWKLLKTYFYTGVPDIEDDPFWHNFWAEKLRALKRRGVEVFSRSLRYRNKIITLPDGTTTDVRFGQEKGIDVRLALDVVRLALDNQYEVAIIFSQDQDLSEVADEIKKISIQQNRWLRIASAFPVSSQKTRGIKGTEWIKIDKTTYDTCIDSKDYRPRQKL